MNPVAAALVVAIVAQDPTPLRALPRETAPKLGQLSAGQWLEVREERLGYVKVWDHRHERPGYVKATHVRIQKLDEASAPALAAVVGFLKDSSGAESLGIGYVAAFLKAAPPELVGPDTFDALGTFAERLARRASAKNGSKDETLAAHLSVAAEYGVKFRTFEQPERTRVCYDGEAFRRVLALGGTPEQRAKAALSLTNPDCVDAAISQSDLQTLLEWQTGVLEKVQTADAPGHLANRLRMRRAAVEAQLAFHLARRGEAKRAGAASEEAIRQLALVEKLELGDGDEAVYQETAIRVGASRWSGEDAAAPRGAVTLRVVPGKQPGESCLQVISSAKDAKALTERCTFSVPHPASVRTSPDGKSVAIAVQPLSGWLELWMFLKIGEDWTIDLLVPAATEPVLGYVELAGWSPDSTRLLVVREAKVDGKTTREFQILSSATLEVEKRSQSLDQFPSFRKWHSADWKGRTLALR